MDMLHAHINVMMLKSTNRFNNTKIAAHVEFAVICSYVPYNYVLLCTQKNTENV